MAEIKHSEKQDTYSAVVRNSAAVILVLLSAFSLSSQDDPAKTQNRKKIELVYADEDVMIREEQTDTDVHHIIGNVKFRMNESTLTCDSAHYMPEKMQIIAFSRAHIEQGDTLDLYGNYMFYDGKIDIADVMGDVELIDKETHLYTSAIKYDVKNQVANYDKRGRITNGDKTLTSIIGVYYVNQNLFHFKDSVKVVNPDYVMTSDTMNYNTETETVHFTGPSEVRGDSIYMYCERGWYDTKSKNSAIWRNALIDNFKNRLRGDSLFYNDSTGFGEGYRNVIIDDTASNVFIQGNYALYNKYPEKYFMTDRAVFVQVTNDDSLFLHADTLTAITVKKDSLTDFKLVKAYYKCRIFSKDIQAMCDSLTFSFQDTVIKLYDNPVIWSEQNQLTADSMSLFTKNQQTDKLELYNASFVTSRIDTVRFNQIKGDNLTAYFKDDEVYKIDIKGNGESIYYLIDGEELAGLNKSKSANIQILINEGQVTDVIEEQNPTGIIDPPQQLNPKEPKLEGFRWLDMYRPRKKEDIFRKTEKPVIIKDRNTKN